MAETKYHNLASIQDINRIVHQLNEGGYDIAPDQFYDRMLLDTIKLGQEHYVHLKHTENYTLPVGTKKLQKRRWGGLTAHTTPLREGLPPAPDKTSMESITFTATAFGRYMEFTDRVSLDQIDPQLVHYTKELGDVMVRTLERYARQTLLSSASRLYANNRLNVGELVLNDKLTIEDLRFAALRMQRLLVKPLSSGYYNYICSPEFLYDFIDDPLVEKYMQINQTTRTLFEDGKPFPLFQITFIPTMLDEFYTPELDHPGEWFDGDDYWLRVYTVTDSTNAIHGRGAGDLLYYNVKGTDATRKVNTSTVYLHDGTAIEAGQKVTWEIPAFVATNTLQSFIGAEGAEQTITVHDTGTSANQIPTAKANALTWRQVPIHRGILYGQDALVKIGIAGEQNAKTFVQPLGSAGVLDPIHQRQTIGAKINSIGMGILRDESVMVTFSVPSQAMATSTLTAEVVKMADAISTKAPDSKSNFLEHHEYHWTEPRLQKVILDGKEVKNDETIHFDESAEFDHIHIHLSKFVKLVAGKTAEVTIAGDQFGTFTIEGNVLKLVSTNMNASAYVEGTFKFDLASGILEDSAGNKNAAMSITLTFVQNT